MISDVDMAYTKVIVLSKIYDFVVDNFISDQLEPKYPF
jgi:hypothetical protein